MKNLLTAEQAIAFVKDCKRMGKLILGIDGFVVVKGGYEASLDLILDVSELTVRSDEAAEAAEDFLAKHAADDVVFEVWVE